MIRLIILFGSGTNKFVRSESSDELSHTRSLARAFTARLHTEDT